MLAGLVLATCGAMTPAAAQQDSRAGVEAPAHAQPSSGVAARMREDLHHAAGAVRRDWHALRAKLTTKSHVQS